MAVTETGVDLEVLVDAPPDAVFDYFVEPEKMVRWMGTEAKLDARAGGAFRIVIGEIATAAGEFVEVARPDRIVMTWGWEGDDAPVPVGASRVEVTFTARGDGTLVRLVHTELTAEQAGAHHHGWSHYFERLPIAATGGDPGRDAMLDGM